MLRQSFANRLKRARQDKGWSQIQLAVALDMTGPMTVYNWEKGHTFPGLDTVDRIADLLEKDTDWFFIRQPATQGDTLQIGASTGVIGASGIAQEDTARKGRRSKKGLKLVPGRLPQPRRLPAAQPAMPFAPIYGTPAYRNSAPAAPARRCA